MNDHHLDPPGYPEPPDWYSALELAIEEDGMPTDITEAIQKMLSDWCNSQNQDHDLGPEPVIELPDDFYEGRGKCPHGKEWSDCGACDHASDLAFDASREARFSR
jgi:hypothetical protein